MKFPKALELALIKNNKVYFHVDVLESDEAHTELLSWLYELRIKMLTPSKLRALHARGIHSKEIFKLFQNNKKINYLAAELKRRPKNKNFKDYV